MEGTAETSVPNFAPIPSVAKEIVINKPMPFTGDCTRIRGFVQQCKGYLQLNRTIYTNDEAKIAFVLSFLTDGEALKWKETYLDTITDNEGDFVYPTFKIFLDSFTGYFQPLIAFRGPVRSGLFAFF